MSRLIDADALEDSLACSGDIFDYIATIIGNAPTVDAVPVVRGKWIKTRGYYTCSLCGNQDWIKQNYCCRCGAKVEGGE